MGKTAPATQGSKTATGNGTGSIEIDMVQARETKGTFMYEQQLEDGDDRRPLSIYLPKTIIKAEFGGDAPASIHVSITPGE